jgi:hypothetical protein
MIQDGSGYGIGGIEQYHTHTCIVDGHTTRTHTDGYKTLPIPIQVIHYFTLIDNTLGQLGPRILAALIWRDERVIARA